MGKENNKKKSSDFVEMRDLREEQKKLDKKKKKVAIPCSHTNAKGKLKLNFLGKGNLVQCEKCETVFDFSTISHDDLKDAIRIVHNAINQVKVMTDDPEKEYAVISNLGQLDYNLKELEELYRRATNKYGKGEKKKKNKDDFGQYGINALSFTGGKNKKYY